MPTRTQKDKDFIISNLEETYFIENFVTKEDISQLIDSWHKSKNKVYCFMGEMTSETGIAHETIKYSINNEIAMLIKFILFIFMFKFFLNQVYAYKY